MQDIKIGSLPRKFSAPFLGGSAKIGPLNPTTLTCKNALLLHYISSNSLPWTCYTQERFCGDFQLSQTDLLFLLKEFLACFAVLALIIIWASDIFPARTWKYKRWFKTNFSSLKVITFDGACLFAKGLNSIVSGITGIFLKYIRLSSSVALSLLASLL